jgi:hypothetical protein
VFIKPEQKQRLSYGAGPHDDRADSAHGFRFMVLPLNWSQTTRTLLLHQDDPLGCFSNKAYTTKTKTETLLLLSENASDE